MKKTIALLLVLLLSIGLAAAGAESAADLTAAGSSYETAHFTVDAIAVNANGEDFNPNPEFTLYAINDYTAEVPYAYNDATNGVAPEERPNNCASMYMVLTQDTALLIDLGNGGAATVGNFGGDREDAEAAAAVEAEFAQLITELAGERSLAFAITHNHGDHLGYRTAFAGSEGITVYFPEQDYTEEYFGENFDVQLFTPGELTIDLGNGVTIDSIWAGGHSAGSTVYALNVPEVQYSYDDQGNAVSSSGIFYVFGGDAIGSGHGVYIFSYESLEMLAESVPGVVAKLETYNTYEDGISEEPRTDGNISVLGGHGWQKYGRFGELTMDIDFVRNLQTLLEIAATGEWVDEGSDTSNEQQLLSEGNVVLYNWGYESWLGNTIYYGKDTTRVNAIDLNLEALNAYAGIEAEAE